MATNLIWLLIPILFLTQCLAGCPREEIGNFVWAKHFSTVDAKTSTPMCLDSNHLPVTRKCVNNKWVPNKANIKCEFKQNDNWKDTFCPPSYNRVPNTTLCIKISAPQKWSDLCFQSTEADPLLIKHSTGIRKILSDHGYERYWLPIRRKNRLDHLLYKIITRFNFKFNDLFLVESIDGDCLNLMCSSSRCTFQLSNCDKLYSMVCLINVDTFYKFAQHHCSQGSYTTFNPQYHNNCYRIDRFNVLQPILHPMLINNEQAQFLADMFLMTGSDLSGSHVQVDIMPRTSNKYESTKVRNFNRTNWINDSRHINFTNWDSNCCDPRLNYFEAFTTIKNGKWQLVEFGRLIELVIHVEQIDWILEPVFETFQFNKHLQKFQMNMGSQKAVFLIENCFLNDDHMHGSYMSFDIGRKNLRCEGFTMKTLKLIKSPTIEVWSPETSAYEIFVIIKEKNCTKCDFIHESRLLEYEILAMKKLTFPKIGDMIIQFRKIIDIDVKSCITKFSLHVLVKKSVLSLKSLYEMLPQALDVLPYNNKNINLRHIDLCLGKSGKYFNFPDVLIGEKSTNHNCKLINGEHPTLKCIGDSNLGAFWENEINVNRLKCDYGQLLQNVKQNMSKLDPVDVIDVLVSTTTQSRNTIKTLEFSTKIINDLLNNLEKSRLFDLASDKPEEERPFAKLVKTYDNALQTSDCLVQESHEAEKISSNFLDSYQKTIESFLKSKAANISLYGNQDRTYLIQERNIILLVIDPFLGNITGMSIHRKRLRRKEMNFNGFTVIKLLGNEIAKDKNIRRLEAGINLDPRTINKLKKSYTKFRIVLSVFYKDSWFMENSSAIEVIKSTSKIIGIFIPEYPNLELPEGISTILKTTQNRRNTEKSGCSNWRVGSQVRGWNKNFHEYKQLDRKMVSCPIKHTSFSGYVQLIGNDKLIECDVKSHEIIIKWITIIMSTLSVISVVLIFVTLKVPAFAANETTPLILFLAFANGLQIGVYILLVEFKLFNADGNEMIEEFCLATGATLHFLTLVGFFISLFATDHLIRAYIIGSNQLVVISFKIKIILFGWIVPIMIVGLCVLFDIIFDTELYLPIDFFDDHSSICYPVEELLLFSIHIPIGIIVTLHVIIFIWVVIKTNRNLDSVITKVSRVKEKFQTYVYIFSILSITWLFALIIYYVENCWVHLVFSYLFAITAPSQGFQIFLMCIVLNGDVQYYFKRWRYNRK